MNNHENISSIGPLEQIGVYEVHKEMPRLFIPGRQVPSLPKGIPTSPLNTLTTPEGSIFFLPDKDPPEHAKLVNVFSRDRVSEPVPARSKSLN